jgi:hypothetical protein
MSLIIFLIFVILQIDLGHVRGLACKDAPTTL